MTNRNLVDYVKRAINSGAKEISIPAGLLAGASKETIEEVRRLCKVCGVALKDVRM